VDSTFASKHDAVPLQNITTSFGAAFALKMVGSVVGYSEGDTVGSRVGLDVGSIVGLSVGNPVGSPIVGIKVEFVEGSEVESVVG